MKHNLTTLRLLTGRHVKLYFKDRVNFFMSLITPLILLVLFVTFLKNVYSSSFTSMMPKGYQPDSGIINAFTGGWLLSSILGTSSVTVAFCSNIFMVQDKMTGRRKDLLVSPVRRDVLAISYYLANVLATLIVCMAALGVGLLYLATVGWTLTAGDVAGIVGDTLLCLLFGTALAALVEHFISSQGGISAVATLVSSMYGFLCGAYMPLSQFSEPIRNFAACIPGTHGVVLLRQHFMRGAIDKLAEGIPAEGIEAIRKAFDNELVFFGHRVSSGQMVAVLLIAWVVLLAAYVLVQFAQNRRTDRKA